MRDSDVTTMSLVATGTLFEKSMNCLLVINVGGRLAARSRWSMQVSDSEKFDIERTGRTTGRFTVVATWCMSTSLRGSIKPQPDTRDTVIASAAQGPLRHRATGVA